MWASNAKVNTQSGRKKHFCTSEEVLFWYVLMFSPREPHGFNVIAGIRCRAKGYRGLGCMLCCNWLPENLPHSNGRPVVADVQSSRTRHNVQPCLCWLREGLFVFVGLQKCAYGRACFCTRVRSCVLFTPSGNVVVMFQFGSYITS